MGLFDKLKKKIMGNESNSVSPAKMSAMPTSKFEKEDFSSLSNIQVLEKIDQYVSEYKRTPNNMVFEKLSNAVDEFDVRFSSIPLSKRGAISQEWSFLKAQRDNLGRSAAQPIPSYVNALADQIASFVGKIYTELCK